MKLFCNRCKKEVEPIISEQSFVNGDGTKGGHIRADCPLCKRWIKWLAK